MLDNKKVINKIEFGKTIKHAREIKKLTQFALSEELNISQNFLGDIERGIKLPSVETLIKIANYLNLSLDTMFASSLNNYLAEEENVVYTDKQLHVLNSIVKNIKDNFR